MFICKSLFDSEITQSEFEALLKEVAPKYAKDHKVDGVDAAVNKMKEQIVSHDPSLAGTTVSDCSIHIHLHSKTVSTKQHTVFELLQQKHDALI